MKVYNITHSNYSAFKNLENGTFEIIESKYRKLAEWSWSDTFFVSALYLTRMKREFNAIEAKFEFKVQRKLEAVELARRSKLEAKFKTLERTKTWSSDMKKMRSISNNEMKRQEVPSADWYQELIYNLPGNFKGLPDKDSMVFRLRMSILAKLSMEALIELPPESITAPSFFKVLNPLKPSEIKCPEIASAIEFVRKHVIINLKREQFDAWFENEFKK